MLKLIFVVRKMTGFDYSVLEQRKSVFSFFDPVIHKPECTATEASWLLAINQNCLVQIRSDSDVYAV